MPHFISRLIKLKLFRNSALGFVVILLPAVVFLSAFNIWPFGNTQSAGPAHNVILFIGDGMGVSTVTAARIYDGQSRGGLGEENVLSFETFPQTALVKTYNTNLQVPDSAGTATAMNTGIKTRAGVINIDPKVHRNDCAEAQESALPLLSTQVLADGKAVGFVSTTRLTHATPAAVYAHSADRDWEDDRDMPMEARTQGCQDIATQMMGFPFTVALGGGAQKFRGVEHRGRRLTPSEDLVAEWQAKSGGTFVSTASELSTLSIARQPVLGLFAPSHMTYMLNREKDTTEPTLTEMTRAAISVAEKNPKGYFLMIEGGRIDHGHHAGRPALALSETQEFAQAVQAALDMVDLSDTLILVTADHSHVFTMAGYPARGNPILGLVKGVDDRGEPKQEPTLAADGQPYTTLGYQNGPGAIPSFPRPAPMDDPNGVFQALIPTGNYFTLYGISETHGGEDVALYAIGPGAEAVHGVIEQNKIYDIMHDAMGLAD